MTYRQTNKRKELNKLWSVRANAKQAKRRQALAEPCATQAHDRSIHITIERPGTNETARFELLSGNRIDNYSVYCNGQHLGIMGITRVMAGIRKALPITLC